MHLLAYSQTIQLRMIIVYSTGLVRLIKNDEKRVCLSVMFTMSTTYIYIHFMRFEITC